MRNTRETKLNQVIEYFLEYGDFDFYNAITKHSKDESGYYLTLESDSIKFTTFLDNIYIDNATSEGIIKAVENDLEKYIENNGENVTS